MSARTVQLGARLESRPSSGRLARKPKGPLKSAAGGLNGRSLRRGRTTRVVITNSATTNIESQKVALYEELEKVAPNGLIATPDDKSRIAEIVSAIEQSNPTEAPAQSPLMPGFWRMLYTDMEPAPSSGKLGPFVGDVFQDLRPENSLILNLLKVGFPPIRGGLSAALDIISDDTWRITFADINQYLGPFKVQTKLFDQEKPEVRLWRITYLDDDLRIMRAKKEDDPDEGAFIFVLRRSEAERFALGQL
uniref:Plastid lipid-associated protein/fibrillin conserved domain-containing protein n=1 Tax=Pyramimonas obovata TaxID=1411642 RepID=A0A7S0NAH0_9CHLO|mmetsp:Transcript_23228/g.50880  ORF Transcript_23228/g.50880 Transcript_23228/m.50880 type:complete len:249 (+) Transcript_23228:165-911(+)|eukprot:CAMPEP_0118922484 /NCGR_PEP_ID=MMETSP1169-20130426/1393_1 /TAXON_ID=36882 /ORGANISM="Pyramimonas obovata, Strain CCMP722" /LENGTH=248 /DNA_ID=CAMNT_0006863359 /DNA_START=137 /DNA_END=883 /DNA_ORIENTATION=-